MELDRKVCDRARRSRDARFDGKFFIAVTSTRIYCRPICPARSPKDENVRYYATAAAAGGGRVPALPALPSRSLAWHTRMVRNIKRRVSSAAIDRRRRA
jgi:AraC family transcriptional regulator of adaptative response / DNA-3-methyladenine glycosylase II